MAKQSSHLDLAVGIPQSRQDNLGGICGALFSKH